MNEPTKPESEEAEVTDAEQGNIDIEDQPFNINDPAPKPIPKKDDSSGTEGPFGINENTVGDERSESDD